MNRIAISILVLSLHFAPRVWAADPKAEQPSAIAQSSALSIRITEAKDLPHVTVVIRNEGTRDLRLFEEGNPWGWNNLCFCVGIKFGGMFYVPHNYMRSGTKFALGHHPTTCTLKPGEELTRKENLADDKWEFPRGLPLGAVSQVFAVYGTVPSAAASSEKVWTGTAVSPWCPAQVGRESASVRGSVDTAAASLNQRGEALAAEGRIDEATTQWQKALAIEPNYPEAHVNLGKALVSRGRIGEGMAHYRKALEIQPNYPEAHVGFGNALVRLGRVDEGIAHYQKALKLNPGYAEAHIDLGTALARRGRIDEAIEHYQKALEIQPDYAEAHVNLGVALAGRGRIDEAKVHFQRALEIKPNYPEAHFVFANVLASCGRVDEGIAQFRRALAIKPDFAEAHNGLGALLAANGRLDEAIAHFRRALEIKPQYAEAKKNLEDALARHDGKAAE
jgi:Tfp pilus assembly protein PilF